MDPSAITFSAWSNNHPRDHYAKWCRELYPWELFRGLDYDKIDLGVAQPLTVAGRRYFGTIKQRFVTEDGRNHYVIQVRSTFSSERQRWSQREWDDVFHLVSSSTGEFITIFTQKKDPSKTLLARFLKSRLTDLESVRSLPVSSMLFRALVSTAAHDRYDDLKRFERFQLDSSNVPYASLAPAGQDTYEPFLCRNRDLWITCSFTEEKAHRQALRLAGQTNRILAVFCHPTFTRHHRCTDETVSVLSLSEFLRSLSPAIHRRYIKHARFLINHLRRDFDESEEDLQSNSIRDLILKTEQAVPIRTSDLREAKAGLGMIVATVADAAYVCACANLLNAALNRRLRTYDGSLKLAKEVYSFKAILGRAIDDMSRNPPPDVHLYVEREALVYICVRGLQFSFHAIARTPAIRAYQQSQNNRPQAWSGKRLQPVAPLVLRWARSLLLEEGSVGR